MSARILNNIVLSVLIILCLLTITGLLNFGQGLGNIVYFPPIILATVGHLILTRRFSKTRNNTYWIPLIIISALICVGIAYKATIGRGSEFTWNGEIFFTK